MAAFGYDIKNGIKYAKISISKRVDGQVMTEQTHLGRVLVEKKGIYQNRERGVFTYDPKTDTYGKPPASFVPPAFKRKGSRENLILDFGDTFFLSEYIKQKGLSASIDALSYGNPDTLYALIYYYILCNMSNYHAQVWFEGCFVRELIFQASA